jgi:hypothetical protein
MKTLKFIAVLIFWAGFTSNYAHAQSTSTKDIDRPWSVFIPCAGESGEWAVGTLTLHVVATSNKKGNLEKLHDQPMGGELVGQVTGNIYRPTGVTQNKGLEPYSYVNIYHMVGPGIQYFVKEVNLYVILPDGEWKLVVDKSEVICK